MAQDVKSLPLDTPIDKLPPGEYRLKLKAKHPTLAMVLKYVAGLGFAWGSAIVPMIEALNPKLKLPTSNFIGKTFRPRKGWDEKTQTFWFWVKVVK